MRFINEEMVDMILFFGECRRNARVAQQLFAERFPNRQHPTINLSLILLYGSPAIDNPEMEMGRTLGTTT